jgi:hypothetical protein
MGIRVHPSALAALAERERNQAARQPGSQRATFYEQREPQIQMGFLRRRSIQMEKRVFPSPLSFLNKSEKRRIWA